MKTFCIKSNGCAVLVSETERIAKYFDLNGWQLVEDPSVASINIFTCCGVTNNEEDESLKILDKINGLRREDSMLIVSGCLPAIATERILSVAPCALLLKYKELSKLDSIINARTPFGEVHYNGKGILKAENQLLSFKNDKDWLLMNYIDSIFKSKKCVDAWDKATIRKYSWQNDDTFQIRVSYGCTGNCSYCATKLGIGSFQSVEESVVMQQFKDGLNRGFDKFVLMGDEIGAYGIDKDNTLIHLLDLMYSESQGNARIAIRYIQPDYIVKMYDQLKPFFEKGFISYFCSAIQSASPTVLKRMNRNPNIEPFIKCMEDINENGYEVSKHTQIIVGFPGETADDFMMTLECLNRCQFDHININLFSPRPKTKAWNLVDNVDMQEKKRRANIIRHTMNLNKKAMLYDAIKDVINVEESKLVK